MSLQSQVPNKHLSKKKLKSFEKFPTSNSSFLNKISRWIRVTDKISEENLAFWTNLWMDKSAWSFHQSTEERSTRMTAWGYYLLNEFTIRRTPEYRSTPRASKQRKLTREEEKLTCVDSLSHSVFAAFARWRSAAARSGRAKLLSWWETGLADDFVWLIMTVLLTNLLWGKNTDLSD